MLCRYRYDALNRLVASAPSAQADTRRFYLKDRLATEIKINPDAVVHETMSQNAGTEDFIDPDIQEKIVRLAIPKRIIKLEKEQSRYIEKIDKLQAKSSKVR